MDIDGNQPISLKAKPIKLSSNFDGVDKKLCQQDFDNVFRSSFDSVSPKRC